MAKTECVFYNHGKDRCDLLCYITAENAVEHVLKEAINEQQYQIEASDTI